MSLTPPIPSLEEAVGELIALLPENFPVKNPDPYSAFGTYLRLAAQVGLDVRALIEALAPQLLLTRATGAWLDEHAWGLGLARKKARQARLRVRLSATSSGSFPEMAVLGLGDLRYLVRSPHFAPGAEVEVIAESPGARYNLPVGTRLQPITVVPGLEGGEVIGVIEAGLDEETDEELRARCILSWPALSQGSTYHAYMSWALSDPEVRKVQVLDDHPRGQGTVDVVIAPSSGLPSPELIARVQAIIDERRPLTADVLVRGPSPVPLNLSLRVYPEPGAPGAQTFADRARLFIHSLGIGETFYPSRLMDALHGYGQLRGVEVSPNVPVSPPQDGLLVPGTISVELS